MTKTIKAWGIPFGLFDTGKTEEVTIEMQCESIDDFKKTCEEAGHKITEEPYVCSDDTQEYNDCHTMQVLRGEHDEEPIDCQGRPVLDSWLKKLNRSHLIA